MSFVRENMEEHNDKTCLRRFSVQYRAYSAFQKMVTGANSTDVADEVDEPETHLQITFADMGIPNSVHLHKTVLGMARPFSDINWNERVFIVLMLLSITISCIMTVYRLTTTDIQSSDFTFCIVLLLNAVFCIWFVIEGVFRERSSEIIVLTLATVLVLIYLTVNYVHGVQNYVKLATNHQAAINQICKMVAQGGSKPKFTINAQLILACIFCPILVILGLFIAWVYHVYRRLMFRTVGANEALQSSYLTLLVFQDFLKFDLQFGSSLIVFIVTDPYNINIQDIMILSVGGFMTLFWFILGYIAMPRESKLGVYIFLLFSPTRLTYVIYKLLETDQSHSEEATSHIACWIGGLVIRLITIITGILVFKNFGKGLKEKLQESQHHLQQQVRCSP